MQTKYLRRKKNAEWEVNICKKKSTKKMKVKRNNADWLGVKDYIYIGKEMKIQIQTASREADNCAVENDSFSASNRQGRTYSRGGVAFWVDRSAVFVNFFFGFIYKDIK